MRKAPLSLKPHIECVLPTSAMVMRTQSRFMSAPQLVPDSEHGHDVLRI